MSLMHWKVHPGFPVYFKPMYHWMINLSHFLAWEVNACSLQSRPMEEVVCLSFEPLKCWLHHAMSSFWSLLTEDSKPSLLLFDEWFNMGNQNMQFPGRFDDLSSELLGMWDHSSCRFPELPDILLVTGVEINTEAAFHDLQQFCHGGPVECKYVIINMAVPKDASKWKGQSFVDSTHYKDWTERQSCKMSQMWQIYLCKNSWGKKIVEIQNR